MEGNPFSLKIEPSLNVILTVVKVQSTKEWRRRVGTREGEKNIRSRMFSHKCFGFALF